jgi:phospholipase C
MTTGFNWASPDYIRLAADVTGDGRADIVAFGPDGIWVATNRGDGSFNQARRASTELGTSRHWSASRHPRLAADLTGDGKADIIGFGDFGVWTALSDGAGGLSAPRLVLSTFGFAETWGAENPRLVGDITGDGRADIVAFASAGLLTALSNGDGTFAAPRTVLNDLTFDHGWRIANHIRVLADVTGDRKADIVAFGDAGVWTALADGTGGFSAPRLVLSAFGFKQTWGPENPRLMGDITGDGRADIVGFANDGVWTALSNGDGTFAAPRKVLDDLGFAHSWRVANHTRTLADVTGDGRMDIVAFGDAGVWVALSNGDGTFQAPRLVVADMGFKQGWRPGLHPRFVTDLTGDGKADLLGFANAGVFSATATGGGNFGTLHEVLNDFGAKSSPIKHIFMLMMENRSFDHLFGFSGITGVDAETGQPRAVCGLSGGEFNLIGGIVTEKFPVQRGAPFRMPTDPQHEFTDVLRQLCIQNAGFGDPSYTPGGAYPPVTNAGFAVSYRRSGGEDAGDVMKCFTPDQIPELMELATKYAICDRWFSSMPGPTWPNRMFAHAASSGYLDDSPSTKDTVWWEIGPGAGFPFGNGSLYHNIDSHGGNWRIYSDDTFPMIAALDGVSIRHIRHLRDLAADIQNAEFDGVQYVHIEPYYDTFGDGPSSNANSHHPVSDLRKGNALIREVYDVIRNSRVWHESMLIITWDEHGGFYDHVKPPAAPRPNDRKTDKSTDDDINHHNFTFDQYGPRVPAIIVSPWIPAGTVDHRCYDHSSIPASVERLFGFPHLTNRDAMANSPLSLCSLPVARDEPPERPTPPPRGGSDNREGRPPLRQRSGGPPPPIPLPMFGYLRSALALDVEVSGRDAALARAKTVTTYDEARTYLFETKQRVQAFRGEVEPPPPPEPPQPGLPPVSRPPTSGPVHRPGDGPPLRPK